MGYAQILLSSRERKALFRASQLVLHETRHKEQAFADHLCEELDDGGIWNPCYLHIVPIIDSSYYPDSGFPVRYILKYAIDNLDEFEHELQMIEDRIKYTLDRNKGPKSFERRPPFLTRDDYYGPNWEEIREETIERDGSKCTICGLNRESHKTRYGKDLHVHHIEPLKQIGNYKEANQLSNFQTVCKYCHRKIHGQ